MKAIAVSGNVDAWVANRQAELSALLADHGALHLTGGAPVDAHRLTGVRDAWGAKAFPVHEGFAPRTVLTDGVYSAPDWASDREMCHHHEQSYGIDHPALLFIAGRHAPETGGSLLLADTRRTLAALPDPVRYRFTAQGWRLIRNYRPYLGLSWSAALDVATRDEADAVCAARDITADWSADGSLRTTQRRPAVTTHPATGEPCWFNDVAFFSQWSVNADERAVMLGAFGADGLPLNTVSGDGEPLSEPEFRAILDAYDTAGERVDLGPGEVLIIDNVLTAHGREPYRGTLDLAMAPAI